MAKRKSSPKPQRRGRAEIDRNYFFGDVLIKTGAAVGIMIGFIAMTTPFTLRDAFAERMYDYIAVMAIFAGIGLFSFLYGRHLRKEATHWDFD